MMILDIQWFSITPAWMGQGQRSWEWVAKWTSAPQSSNRLWAKCSSSSLTLTELWKDVVDVECAESRSLGTIRVVKEKLLTSNFDVRSRHGLSSIQHDPYIPNSCSMSLPVELWKTWGVQFRCLRVAWMRGGDGGQRFAFVLTGRSIKTWSLG